MMRTAGLVPWVVGGAVLFIPAVVAAMMAARDIPDRPPEPDPEPDPEPRPKPPTPGPPVVGPDAANIRGMGITIRTLNHTRYIKGAGKYDGPALVDWCLKNNVRWIELLAAWVQPSGKVKTYLRSPDSEIIAQQLRDAGIKVGIWGWPDPVNDAGFRDAMTEAYARIGAAWLKLNPERPFTWNGPHSKDTREASAAFIMDWARALGPVDVTSYGGGPKSHPSFPWSQFANGARYGRPQWYDKNSSWSARKIAAFLDTWDDYFPAICPILSAVNTNTPAQIQAEADKFIPAASGPAFSYWDFYWAAISSKRTQAIRGVGARYFNGA